MSESVSLLLIVAASVAFGLSAAALSRCVVPGVLGVVRALGEQRREAQRQAAERRAAEAWTDDTSGESEPAGEALHRRGNWYVLVVALIGVVSVGVTFTGGFQDLGVGALSTFGAGVGKVAIALAGFWAFDTWVMRDVDTRQEIIERRNVAYAVVLLGVAVLFGLSVGGA